MSTIPQRIHAKLEKVLLHPLYLRLPLSLRRHALYRRHHGRWGNFRNPLGFGEKMQWRILNDHRELMRWTADKLAQKEYARGVFAAHPELVGVKMPETYWAGSDVRELRALAAQLPSHWVFKPNHSCKRFRLIGASTAEGPTPTANWDQLERLGRRWCARDEEMYKMGHWAYGFARIGLIAEEWIGSGVRPTELKVLSFGGRAHSIMANEDFGTARWRVAYYDANFERSDTGLDFAVPSDAPEVLPAMSLQLRGQLIAAAEALSAPFDFMRVDFYLHDGALWLGELTPYSGSGLVAVRREYDAERGTHWQLPDLQAHDPREAEWRALLAAPLRGTLQR